MLSYATLNINKICLTTATSGRQQYKRCQVQVETQIGSKARACQLPTEPSQKPPIGDATNCQMALYHMLQPSHHYLLLSVSEPSDPLTLRKTLQDSLAQSFGITSCNAYMDILWVSESGSAAVIRAGQTYPIRLL